jgi:S1-C subfamily serine protease
MVANFIVVDGTVAGGSAEKSGIKAKDIIYKINGQEVTSYATLRKMLTAYSVGDKIELTVKRPTQEALEETRNIYRYWELCQDIKITLTFVEFNPNTQ